MVGKAELKELLKKIKSSEDIELYPTALGAIDGGKWSEIKKKFDEIGYCCFTPGQVYEHD